MAKRTCSFDGCENPHHARGWCNTHYMQWRNGAEVGPVKPSGAALATTCSFDGCARPSHARGWCGSHYGQWLKGQELVPVPPRVSNRVCSEDGCDRPHVGCGYCASHYASLVRRRGAAPTRRTRRSQDNYCRTDDLCERGPIEEWCPAFVRWMADAMQRRVILVPPPIDPLALPVEGDCWVWQGNRQADYGYLTVGTRYYRAHRVAVAVSGRSLRGPGWVVDHLCRNKPCVNPDHLEVVTHRENALRGLNGVAQVGIAQARAALEGKRDHR